VDTSNIARLSWFFVGFRAHVNIPYRIVLFAFVVLGLVSLVQSQEIG